MPHDPADIKRRFFDSLKRGTGEAYLIAKENPTIDFSSFLIKAALKNYAYDGQSESSRAQYLLNIIALSKQQEKIRKAILKGLATEQKDTWSLTQLFDLAKIYAQRGDTGAREAIYDRFLNHPIEASDWVGYAEILELDGLKGLIFIAEKFGKLIEENPDDWQDDSIIRDFQKDNPTVGVLQELENAARENKFVRLYLDNINRTKQYRKSFSEKTKTFQNIVDEVINSSGARLFFRKQKFTTSELDEIATQLLLEKNKLHQERLLAVFTNHPFPFDNEFILKKAKLRVNSKYSIVENAIDALRCLKSDEIRNFALDKITNAKRPELYVEILISNYKNGDYKLLADVATKSNNEHVIESLAGSYVEIYKANKTKECKEPLEVLYNKMNCGLHRNSIVEVLIENNVLSEKIKKEIKHDSDLDTRQLLYPKEINL